MVGPVADLAPIDPIAPITEPLPALAEVTTLHPAQPQSTAPLTIRGSLQASTLDGVFATVFSNITGGVLLSNLLVELQASPTEIGLLSSMPMIVNLLQPLGAYLADRTTSRHYYGLLTFGPSRLIWLLLVAGLWFMPEHRSDPALLVKGTLAIVFVTNFLGALGTASWLSWMAALVPRQLRGRYFGFRNSASSLTNLISVPLFGLLISAWPGSSLQAYSVLLLFGVIAGVVSLLFQFWMIDVNPQVQKWGRPAPKGIRSSPTPTLTIEPDRGEFWQDRNFLKFLLYFSLWMFAVSISAPFFNLYLLDNLALDVGWVAIYNSLSSGANLLFLVFWGKLADRIGNRPLLLLVGVLVAVTPLLWLGVSVNEFNLWVWLPFLHILAGATWAAIDLCNNNIQLEIAPAQHHASYFAIAAAVAGVSGALGTTAGSFLAQLSDYGGFLGLFALSSILRLVALLPLVLVKEQRGQSTRQLLKAFLPSFSPGAGAPKGEDVGG